MSDDAQMYKVGSTSTSHRGITINQQFRSAESLEICTADPAARFPEL